jgi:hypothetical protein
MSLGANNTDITEIQHSHTMKIILTTMIAAFLAPALGAFTVNVNSITDPSHILHQIKSYTEMVATVKQVTETARQAQTMVKFLGNPGDAVKSLADLRAINDTLGRIVGDDYGAFEDMGNMLSDIDAIQRNSRYAADMVVSYGKEYHGNVSLYQALWAAEQLSDTVKATYKQHNKARRDLEKELVAAQNKLQNASTEAEREAASAQIALIRAKLGIADSAAAEITRQAALTAKEQERNQEARDAHALDQIQVDAASLAAEIKRQQEEAEAKRKVKSPEQVAAELGAMKFNYGAIHGNYTTEDVPEILNN